MTPQAPTTAVSAAVLTTGVEPAVQHLLDACAADPLLSRHPLRGARIEPTAIYLQPAPLSADTREFALVRATDPPWLQPAQPSDWSQAELARLQVHLRAALASNPWQHIAQTPDPHATARRVDEENAQLQAIFGPGDVVPRVDPGYAAAIGSGVSLALLLLSLQRLRWTLRPVRTGTTCIPGPAEADAPPAPSEPPSQPGAPAP